ncbi:DUF2515 domain-containing protein [Rossellomorea aquimaris]|uniref:DUF2515 family protein n=1 Tax=Rossellomorea aquimaris TaxID=189382 RepID=UPI001CD30F4C|nr:DUF2515 family protein [Rossellomorea aquimaris]MCA1054600.1 DUF2515 domain-containing protein [Rossellomorea aquimaris]
MDKNTITYRFLPCISEFKRHSEWIDCIRNIVERHNQDNITRTIAYQSFYLLHPEIKWSFLASMVSRNAGWNMTDLEGETLKTLLSAETRKNLFMTYERANWSIFQDAFPQLLVYHYSTLSGEKMFHLLEEFNVSSFMQTEWSRYWDERDGERLVKSQIINEQNLIQGPVIEHPVYKRKVFRTGLFFMEDHLHFCSVIFPTLDGRLIGASVHDFRKLDERIKLGEILYKILFHETFYPSIFEFAQKVQPTGSRKDYEEFFKELNNRASSDVLTSLYNKVNHHWDMEGDWSKKTYVQAAWYEEHDIPEDPSMTAWFFRKQNQLRKVAWLKSKMPWPKKRTAGR